ncbi:hypothetical protein SDC9_145190 [bioreactor metagenome]|uniref:Uncharacterized protein n=1 Tax=bioreactor metagenome TaxID=1076179 RepID=A0A645E9C5_9ZZZZ
MRTVPPKADGADFAVAVFGYNTFCGRGVALALCVVIGFAVQKQHAVGILFDRAGITQVSQHRPVVAVRAALGITRKL